MECGTPRKHVLLSTAGVLGGNQEFSEKLVRPSTNANRSGSGLGYCAARNSYSIRSVVSLARVL